MPELPLQIILAGNPIKGSPMQRLYTVFQRGSFDRNIPESCVIADTLVKRQEIHAKIVWKLEQWNERFRNNALSKNQFYGV